jgi:predicted DNA-binding transcriptional regulator AlpA
MPFIPVARDVAMNPNSGDKNTTSSTDSIQIMTAKEVASFLKISIKTVYSYASRGMMPIYWKFQNNIRFEKHQIIAWMRENNQAAPIKTGRMR